MKLKKLRKRDKLVLIITILFLPPYIYFLINAPRPMPPNTPSPLVQGMRVAGVSPKPEKTVLHKLDGHAWIKASDAERAIVALDFVTAITNRIDPITAAGLLTCIDGTYEEPSALTQKTSEIGTLCAILMEIK